MKKKFKRYQSNKLGFAKLFVDIRTEEELENEESYIKDIEYYIGSTISLKAREKDGYSFCYFYNPLNKKILSKKTEYYFQIEKDTCVYLVYHKLTDLEQKSKYAVYNFEGLLVQDDDFNVRFDKNFVNTFDENQTDYDVLTSSAIIELVNKLHPKIRIGDTLQNLVFEKEDKESISKNTLDITIIKNTIQTIQNRIEEIINSIPSDVSGINQRLDEIERLVEQNRITIQEHKELFDKSIRDLKALIDKNTKADAATKKLLLNRLEAIEIYLNEESIDIDFKTEF